MHFKEFDKCLGLLSFTFANLKLFGYKRQNSKLHEKTQDRSPKKNH